MECSVSSLCGIRTHPLPLIITNQEAQLSLVSRVFIGVSWLRHDWLNHWPWDWLQSPAPHLLPRGWVDITGSKPQLQNHIVGLRGMTSTHPETIQGSSRNKKGIPITEEMPRVWSCIPENGIKTRQMIGQQEDERESMHVSVWFKELNLHLPKWDVNRYHLNWKNQVIALEACYLEIWQEILEEMGVDSEVRRYFSCCYRFCRTIWLTQLGMCVTLIKKKKNQREGIPWQSSG